MKTNVVDGSLVHMEPGRKVESQFNLMGQTHSLRRIATDGVVSVKIINPKPYIEQLVQAHGNISALISALQK